MLLSTFTYSDIRFLNKVFLELQSRIFDNYFYICHCVQFLVCNAINNIDRRQITVKFHVSYRRLIVSYRHFLPSVYRNDVIVDH